MKKILMLSLIVSVLATSTVYAGMQSASSSKDANCACQARNAEHMQLCANMHYDSAQPKSTRKTAAQDTVLSVRQDSSTWTDINNITFITEGFK